MELHCNSLHSSIVTWQSCAVMSIISLENFLQLPINLQKFPTSNNLPYTVISDISVTFSHIQLGTYPHMHSYRQLCGCVAICFEVLAIAKYYCHSHAHIHHFSLVANSSLCSCRVVAMCQTGHSILHVNEQLMNWVVSGRELYTSTLYLLIQSMHPPHIGSVILGESITVLQRFLLYIPTTHSQCTVLCFKFTH